ncbi:hypothetical protein A4G99_15350 [Haladaptatus sp. R4]|nr:hypothetical protein A4G99_15350 [Haladaptatus sp. R4]
MFSAVVASTSSPSLNAAAEPLSAIGMPMPAAPVPMVLIADRRSSFRVVVALLPLLPLLLDENR